MIRFKRFHHLLQLNNYFYQLFITVCLVSAYIFPLKVLASPEKKTFKVPFDAMTIGVADKGLTFGTLLSINKTSQFEIGMQYLDGTDIRINPLIEADNPIWITNKSFNIAYIKHLFHTNFDSGAFLRLDVGVSSVSGEYNVDLSKLEYSLGGASVRCSTCGTVYFESTQDGLDLIPSLSFGWQSPLTDQLIFRASVGYQYFDIPNATWTTNMNYSLPKYVQDKINDLADEINIINSFQPTFLIALMYKI